MRLAHKIFLAQSLVILVVAGVAYWSITEVAKLLTANRQVTTRTAEALRLEVSARESMRRAIALEERFVVFGDREYATKPIEAAQEIQDGLARLETRLASELEKARLREAAQQFTIYREATAKGRQLRAGGDARGAGQVISIEAGPAAERFMTEMGSLIDLTQANLDFAQNAAKTALTEAQVAAQRLESQTWYVVVVGLVVAVLAALTGTAAIAIGMTQSLRRLSAATGELAEGRFTPIEVDSTDEIGDLQRSFNTTGERLAELDRMKEQFYATVSHELRSPLTSARESAALLKDGGPGPLTAKQARLAGIIYSSTDRLLHLTNDILDLSRVSAGILPLDVQPVELDRLAARAVDELRVLAEERGIALACETGPGSFAMSGDPNRIVQILVNLIANALRFTPPGGRVTVRLVDAQAELETQIEDSGVGIAPDQLPLVFDRYRQAHTGHGGTGLGLAIVHAMVQAHGGRVGVESEEGKGSRFTVTLPRTPAGARATAVVAT